MAYMSQEKKAKIKAELRKAIPQSWKWSLAVRHHSTVVLTIRSAPVDLIDAYTSKRCSEEVRAACMSQRHMECNPYHWREHFEGELLDVFSAILGALNAGNHDRSDLQTDYHDVGWYVSVCFGRWDKPFEVR